MRTSLNAARDCRDYLDSAIRERKQTPTARDDVLNRCLAMQAAGLPGMDDLGIRNNLIGLLIGAVPTTSKAAIQARRLPATWDGSARTFFSVSREVL